MTYDLRRHQGMVSRRRRRPFAREDLSSFIFVNFSTRTFLSRFSLISISILGFRVGSSLFGILFRDRRHSLPQPQGHRCCRHRCRRRYTSPLILLLDAAALAPPSPPRTFPSSFPSPAPLRGSIAKLRPQSSALPIPVISPLPSWSQLTPPSVHSRPRLPLQSPLSLSPPLSNSPLPCFLVSHFDVCPQLNRNLLRKQKVEGGEIGRGS